MSYFLYINFRLKMILSSLLTHNNKKGDVLMEYVILTTMIIVPLVGLGNFMFNIDGSLTGDDFGLFGNSFVNFYRMVMKGICLPLP